MKDNIASSAYSLIRRKKYKKAKELLLSNRTALNRDANALAMLAFADIFLKDFYAAEEVSRKALREDSFCVNAMLAKGYISLHNGHRENALREYFRILELDPQNKIAKDNIEPKSIYFRKKRNINIKTSYIHTYNFCYIFLIIFGNRQRISCCKIYIIRQRTKRA